MKTLDIRKIMKRWSLIVSETEFSVPHIKFGSQNCLEKKNYICQSFAKQ